MWTHSRVGPPQATFGTESPARSVDSTGSWEQIGRTDEELQYGIQWWEDEGPKSS